MRTLWISPRRVGILLGLAGFVWGIALINFSLDRSRDEPNLRQTEAIREDIIRLHKTSVCLCWDHKEILTVVKIYCSQCSQLIKPPLLQSQRILRCFACTGSALGSRWSRHRSRYGLRSQKTHGSAPPNHSWPVGQHRKAIIRYRLIAPKNIEPNLCCYRIIRISKNENVFSSLSALDNNTYAQITKNLSTFSHRFPNEYRNNSSNKQTLIDLITSKVSCELTANEKKAWPECAGKMAWMQRMWRQDHCYEG